MHYIITNGGIHLVALGKPYTVARTDANYNKVVEALKAKASDAEVVEILTGKISRIAQKVRISKHLSLHGGIAFYKGEPLDKLLSARLQLMVDEGFDLAPIEHFIENLGQNPSNNVFRNLPCYLEIAKSPLTEDGCFLSYMVVDSSFMPLNSAVTSRHLPGQRIEVPRNRILEDLRSPCAFALQVWSFEKAKQNIPELGHLLVCKINPKDVVAVSEELQTLRVCAYDILYSYDEYLEEDADSGDTCSVATGEAPFVLETYDFDGRVVGSRRFTTLVAAANEFERCKIGLASFIREMKLFNSSSSTVISEYHNPDFEDISDANSDNVNDGRYVVEVTDTAGTSVRHVVYSLKDALELMVHYLDSPSVKVIDDKTGAVVKSMS